MQLIATLSEIDILQTDFPFESRGRIQARGDECSLNYCVVVM